MAAAWGSTGATGRSGDRGLCLQPAKSVSRGTEPAGAVDHLGLFGHRALGRYGPRKSLTLATATGGLLHGSWRHISARERRVWRRELAGEPIDRDVFLVLAFGYADARWDELRQQLDRQLPAGFVSYRLWQPSGIEFSQQEFDEILQACDLNFVRGEDSFVRAHWAAAGPWQVPFIWQPYRQPDVAHRHKLAGWMHQTLADPALAALCNFHWAWNGIRPADAHADLLVSGAWRDLVDHYQGVRLQLNRACLKLAAQESLERGLIRAFGRKISSKKS